VKWKIIKKFSTENNDCFSYGDVLVEYLDKDRSYLSKPLVFRLSGYLGKRAGASHG